jgi:hypothetical protein
MMDEATLNELEAIKAQLKGLMPRLKLRRDLRKEKNLPNYWMKKQAGHSI